MKRWFPMMLYLTQSDSKWRCPQNGAFFLTFRETDGALLCPRCASSPPFPAHPAQLCFPHSFAHASHKMRKQGICYPLWSICCPSSSLLLPFDIYSGFCILPYLNEFAISMSLVSLWLPTLRMWANPPSGLPSGQNSRCLQSTKF